MQRPRWTAEALTDLLVQAADEGYIGEPVSQLAHALQCAELARASGAPDVEVIAALLHDIGHLCAAPSAATMGGVGVVAHETIGAEALVEAGFGAEVAALVGGHIEAKRYLAFAHPRYAARLSAASTETLRYQGGPMSRDEAARFEADPFFAAKLRLRAWDDQAKLEGAIVPSIEAYRPAIARLLDAGSGART